MMRCLVGRTSVLLLTLISPMAFAGAPIAIHAGGTIDVEAGQLLGPQTILIEGSKIVEIGAKVEIPAGAQVLDLSAAVVLPGLYDVHTHLCSGARVASDDIEAAFERFLIHSLLASSPYRSLLGAANAREMLMAGFTTVRDLGNAGEYADVALKRALRERLIPGPTIDVAGKIIAPFGGQFQNSPEHPDLGRQDYLYADSPDEIRRAIRQNIHFGADWIKVVVDEMPYSYSAEDLRFIVSEAAAAGRQVAAHCGGDEATRAAIEAGVATIEHATGASVETLELARDRGVVLVGTDHSRELLTAAGLPEAFVDFRAQALLERLRRARQAGVEMAFGSDVPIWVEGHSRGSAAMSVIDTWIEAGIPAAKILRAMITTPARLLDDAGKRGVLRPGARADLIAVPGSPLENIEELKQVFFVMKDGVVVRRDEPGHTSG